jgi:hypothetical protein
MKKASPDNVVNVVSVRQCKRGCATVLQDRFAGAGRYRPCVKSQPKSTHHGPRYGLAHQGQRTSNMTHGPNDVATQWLLDQMHDPHVSLRHRMECAKILLEIHPSEFNVRWVNNDPNVPVIRIVIEGLGEPVSREVSVDPDPLQLN